MMYIKDDVLLKETQKEKKVQTSSSLPEEVMLLQYVSSLQTSIEEKSVMNGSDGESRSASSNQNILEHNHFNAKSSIPPATITLSNLLAPESPPRSRLIASPGSTQPTFLSVPFPSVTISSTPSSSTLSQSSSHPAQSPPVSQVTFISEHPVNLCPSPVKLQLPAEDDFLNQR
jgi:hypothetical protein